MELVRYAGHGTAQEVCTDTLAVTKVDWNNGALYGLSVTLEYAKDIARTLSRLPTALQGCPYRFRLFT